MLVQKAQLKRCPDAYTKDEVVRYINGRLDYLKGSRPTAVDLSNAIMLLKKRTENTALSSTTPDQTLVCADIRMSYIVAAEKILEDDHTTNLAIGRYGAEYLRRQQLPVTISIDEADMFKFFTTSPPATQGLADMTYRKLSVLTHCNTGYTILIGIKVLAIWNLTRVVQFPRNFWSRYGIRHHSQSSHDELP